MDKKQILKLSCVFALVGVAFCTRLDCVLKTPEVMMRESAREQQRLEAKRAAQERFQEQIRIRAEEIRCEDERAEQERLVANVDLQIIAQETRRAQSMNPAELSARMRQLSGELQQLIPVDSQRAQHTHSVFNIFMNELFSRR